MLDRLLAQVRRLRRRAAAWSVGDDRAFHDTLFGVASHDPFDRSFPGYVTIRRFADLGGERIRGARTVLDLGCGPGEITCELARRFPSVEFIGVDHSAVAIERARGNGKRLGLTNSRFAAADLTTFVPDARVDLVVMFDAFHHLVDPAAFVARLGTYTDRFFLIEPAGDALGRWRRAVDFDWLPCEFDKIRARIEYVLGTDAAGAEAAAGDVQPEAGRAIENRYPEADYRRFFAGFAVEFEGTVAGFDVYPPAPHHSTAWRARLMDAAYDAVVHIDRDLHAQGLDLHAKHWAIDAVRGATAPARRVSRPPADRADASPEWRVQGSFDASYGGANIPAELPAGQEVTVETTVKNLSWRTWTSETERPILVSYHWLDPSRRVVEYDGMRTRLPRPLAPGDQCAAAVRVRTPARAGSYLLEIDLVEENVSWFSAAGVPPLRIKVRVE
jgi:SAM-dependent methyltransferase